MKAIIKGAHFLQCVRCYTRHATPVAFTHILCVGVGGQGALTAIDPAATGLFVFWHPTLGDWSTVPALGKTAGGAPIHVFGGVTPADGGSPLTADEFSSLRRVELYVRGHVRRHTEDAFDANGVRFVGLTVDDSTILDSVLPQFVPWRSDVDGPTLPLEYTDGNGNPIVDPDEMHDTALYDPN